MRLVCFRFSPNFADCPPCPVTRLNEIRARPKPSTSGEGAKDEPVEVEENRVDTILNDVFQVSARLRAFCSFLLNVERS